MKQNFRTVKSTVFDSLPPNAKNSSIHLQTYFMNYSVVYLCLCRFIKAILKIESILWCRTVLKSTEFKEGLNKANILCQLCLLYSTFGATGWMVWVLSSTLDACSGFSNGSRLSCIGGSQSEWGGISGHWGCPPLVVSTGTPF